MGRDHQGLGQQARVTGARGAALAAVLERFQAKWTPVRVKKTREYKNLEHFHVSTKLKML